MYPIFTIISLFSFMAQITPSIMKSGMKKFQQQCVDIATPIIIENLHKPYVSRRMYISMVLLNYSKDTNLFNNFFSMDKEERIVFLKNKYNNITNFFSFNDAIESKGFVFLVWAGGKSNYKRLQQYLLNAMLKKNPHITKYYDVFLGGFGGIYNSLPILIKHGIKEVFASDINPSLINLYRQVQKNYKMVQHHLASIPLDYFKEHGKFYPETKEEAKALFEKIHKDFTALEKAKLMNAKRAAYFMFLNGMSRAGMLKFDMKSKLNTFHFSYYEGRNKKVPLLINKVEIFHKIFNLEEIKITFSIKKYQSVIKRIKNDANAFVFYDSPYIKYEEVLSNKIRNCSYNYGVDDFNQKELLYIIKNSINPFIYFNNHNPVIRQFSLEQNFHYHKEEMIYKNGEQKEKQFEIIMHSDRDTQIPAKFTIRKIEDKNLIELPY